MIGPYSEFFNRRRSAMDFFVVPTIAFRPLYGLPIMVHGRRQILVWSYRASDGRIDRQPTDGGVWLGANPSLPDPGSRSSLW